MLKKYVIRDNKEFVETFRKCPKCGSKHMILTGYYDSMLILECAEDTCDFEGLIYGAVIEFENGEFKDVDVW